MAKLPPPLLWLNPADLEIDSRNAALFRVERPQIEKLKASMQRLGYRPDRPIVVRRTRRNGKYRVLDGWHRTLAAQELELSLIPVVIDPHPNKSGNPPPTITSNLILNQLSRRLPQGQRLVLIYLLSLLKTDHSEPVPPHLKRQAWWTLAGVSKTTWLQARKYIGDALQAASATRPELAPPDILHQIILDRTISPNLHDLYHGKHTFTAWRTQATANSSTPLTNLAKKLLAVMRDYLRHLLADNPVDSRLRDRTRFVLELSANTLTNDHDANARVLEFCKVIVDLLQRQGKRMKPAPHATLLPLFSSLPEDSHPNGHSESAA